jgi:hypothetical protein
MISPPCSPAADTILDADATDNEPELIDSVGVDDAKSARSSSERDDASAKSSSKEGTTSPITAPKLPTSEDGESQAELPAPKLGLISVALAKGIRYVDNPEAPFGCPHCNKSYASKKSLSVSLSLSLRIILLIRKSVILGIPCVPRIEKKAQDCRRPSHRSRTLSSSYRILSSVWSNHLMRRASIERTKGSEERRVWKARTVWKLSLRRWEVKVWLMWVNSVSNSSASFSNMQT